MVGWNSELRPTSSRREGPTTRDNFVFFPLLLQLDIYDNSQMVPLDFETKTSGGWLHQSGQFHLLAHGPVVHDPLGP